MLPAAADSLDPRPPPVTAAGAVGERPGAHGRSTRGSADQITPTRPSGDWTRAGGPGRGRSADCGLELGRRVATGLLADGEDLHPGPQARPGGRAAGRPPGRSPGRRLPLGPAGAASDAEAEERQHLGRRRAARRSSPVTDCACRRDRTPRASVDPTSRLAVRFRRLGGSATSRPPSLTITSPRLQAGRVGGAAGLDVGDHGARGCLGSLSSVADVRGRGCGSSTPR